MANSGNSQTIPKDLPKSDPPFYKSPAWEKANPKSNSFYMNSLNYNATNLPAPTYSSQKDNQEYYQNSYIATNPPQTESHPNQARNEYYQPPGQGYFNAGSFAYGSNNTKPQQSSNTESKEYQSFQHYPQQNPSISQYSQQQTNFPQPQNYNNVDSQKYGQQQSQYGMYPDGTYQYPQVAKEPENLSSMYNQWYPQPMTKDIKSNNFNEGEQKKEESWNDFYGNLPLCQRCTERVNKHLKTNDSSKEVKRIVLNSYPNESNRNVPIQRGRSPSPAGRPKKRFPTTIDDRN